MERCKSNQVGRLFLPNVDADSVEKVFALAADYPDMCYPMLGLHPCSVKEGWEQEMDVIKQAKDQGKIYAVGEIGIDLYWDKTTLPEQIKAFKTQINWAKELKLPIVIHCREAFDEVFKVLEEEQDENLAGYLPLFYREPGASPQSHRPGLLPGYRRSSYLQKFGTG